MKYILLFVVCILPSVSNAGWYGGKISQINVGYDGQTITVIPEGWSRDNCTCYSGWPNTMCLDASRDTSNFERSLVLSARARGTRVFFMIDETTCMVRAMYEYN